MLYFLWRFELIANIITFALQLVVCNMKITSVNNRKVLQIRKLYKNRERKESNLFIAEGVLEVSRGLEAGFDVEMLFYCPDIFQKNINDFLQNYSSNFEIFEVEKEVYKKLTYRDNTEGILAVFGKKIYSLDDIKVNDKSLFIVLESVEKPGNLGAVLRTADAAAVDAIIITESLVDQYHPNVIRASIGAVFNIPVVLTNNEELSKWLKNNDIGVYSAALPAYGDLYSLDMTGKTALIFGTESNGLSDFWLENSTKNYTIPMRGIVDSLNVSVSVAVSVFEAVRQRK